MNKRLQALLQRRAAAIEKMKGIQTAAGEGLLSEEQTAQFEALNTEVTGLNSEIDRVKAMLDLERGAGAVVITDPSTLQTPGQQGAQDLRHGFRSLGEFAAVAFQAQMHGLRDDRLAIGAAASTYANESSLADGGYLVPPEFSAEVWRHSLDEDAFVPLTANSPIQGNTMSYPKDETTPWGSDGVRAYWEAEASQATATKPKGTVNTLRLNKLFALIPVTDELQQDAMALGGYIADKASESIRWKSNLSIFNGTGVGQPEGLFRSGARVDVAKESGQAADTVVATNVAKMFARQINVRNAVWLINPSVLPQLIVMTIGNQPIWTPPSEGMKGLPMGMLLGRPIISTQQAMGVGDVGDIGLVNFKYVRSITKAGGIETATSMHLYFDQGLNAFRFTFRLDAKPTITAAVTPANGNDTLSPFVFLAERA